MRPFPIAGGAYSDEARAYDAQDCVNYLPEGADTADARSQAIMRGAPGLTVVATLPGAGGGRGLRNVNGQLYAVQGDALYSISGAFVATSLGTVNGSGRVSMTHNQVASGNEVTIVTGPLGYVWNSATSTMTQLAQGGSSGFVGSSVTGFIDGYTLQLEPLGQYWYCSDLVDSLTYEPVNQFQASADPDIIKSLIVSHNQVWAFGTKTIEQFAATGELAILFQPVEGLLMEIGIGGSNTAAVIDNTVYFLGSDGIVYYVVGGYLPVRCSTFAVEQDIKGKKWEEAYAMTWTDRGHKVFYLTFPDGHTWGYDISQKVWHRRESYGVNNWRISHLEYWNDAWYALDSTNGNVYLLDWNAYTEAGQPLVARRVTPVLSNMESRLFLSVFQLYVDFGRGPVIPDTSVSMRYSDDGGYTWSNWKVRSVTTVRNAQARLQFKRLGQFRDRVFDIMISGNCRRDIIAAYIQAQGQS